MFPPCLFFVLTSSRFVYRTDLRSSHPSHFPCVFHLRPPASRRKLQMHRSPYFCRTLAFAVGALLLSVVASTAAAQCQLNSPGGKIKHVVYIEFDNVHFSHDNPNVPSDFEQMPILLNFIK